ncbi:MAG: CHASE2 domain-containing protein [Elainella sp. Prado103]|nr:CHASE2 domain-containing protein [Elainella sp. Prado103]
MTVTKFHLRIHQVEQRCLFELTWGADQRLPIAQVPWLPSLERAYHQWQAAYLQHYKSLPVNPRPESSPLLRGQLISQGQVKKPPANSHADLVKAEQQLLLEFHDWLGQRQLQRICTEIARASRSLPDQQSVQLLLTCDPSLMRLPWETWEIGAENALTGNIQILRVPVGLRAPSGQGVQNRSRPRILVILSDDGQLDLEVDQKIIRSLSSVATVQFIRREPQESVTHLKQRIIEAIVDPTGWDMLFFAGHSSETALTGGELEIAHSASIQISEITARLSVAQQHGLRAAVFNSCEGLSFADSLLDLGLDQVVVMREKVHSRVAQEFLLHFCQQLTQHQNIHTALIAACQFLKTEKNLTYPSGYLLPSLFCRPAAPLFRIPPKSWKSWLQRLKPKRYEVIAATGLIALSLLPPVQDFLLDRRIWVQTHYRQVMGIDRLANAITIPPTLLVRIDDESLNRAKIEKIQYIDRSYLAQLIKRLSATNASVIGLDYVLDRSQEGGEQVLADAIRNAKNSKFVFGSFYGNDSWLEAKPEFLTAGWSVSGDITGVNYYTTLLDQMMNGRIPFPYWLVWLHQCCVERSSVSLEQVEQMKANRLDPIDANLITPEMKTSWITRLSYQIGQIWFHPILDYSIPPQQVYTDVPAWRVLQQPNAPELANVSRQVVLIAPGGYSEAGAQEAGQDTFQAPLAMQYWYVKRNPKDATRQITGGENHAYVIHHLLNRHLVVPLPDLWMVLLAVLFGKVTVMLLHESGQARSVKSIPKSTRRWLPWIVLGNGTALYSLISFQLYLLPSAVLVPIVLPVTSYWLAILPTLLKRKS